MPRKATRKQGLKRTVIVEAEVDKKTHDTLLSIANILAMAYNELNYLRRRLFFQGKLDAKAMNETYKQVYKKYSDVYRIEGKKQTLFGSDTLQAVLNMNDDTWKAFFKLLKAKKEGKVPKWLKANPPRYSKKGRKRIPFIRLKARQWELKGDSIIIKGVPALGKRFEVRIKGRIHLDGERGELMLRYDVDRKKWYAYLQIYATRKLYEDGWKNIPLQSAGNGIAGIDIGINNLFAVYAIRPDGKHVSKLFNGRPLKAIYFYWKYMIAEYQSMLNKYGYRTSRRLRQMYRKMRLQMKNYIDHQIRELFRWLRDNGIGTIVVGLPHDIAHQNSNEYTVNIWSYGYIIRRLKEVAEEQGITIYFVTEEHTSTTCPFHGTKECGKRITRGLFKCFRMNKVMNADLVGAFNILKKILHNPESSRRGRIGVMGRRPGPGVNPKKGDVRPNLPALAGTPALKDGEEVRRGGSERYSTTRIAPLPALS